MSSLGRLLRSWVATVQLGRKEDGQDFVRKLSLRLKCRRGSAPLVITEDAAARFCCVPG